MTFQCPHCRSSAFLLLTGSAGTSQAECLDCGRISPFTAAAMRNAPERKQAAKTLPDRSADGERKTAD
jgi:hypothetical protein